MLTTTHEIAARLTRELKIKPRVRAHQLIDYAKRLNVSGNFDKSNGKFYYYWSETEYQQLIKIYEP